MDPSLIPGLLNFGGVGVCAAVLLWLHVTSLKAFREELASERGNCTEMWQQILAQMLANHETVLAKLNEMHRGK